MAYGGKDRIISGSFLTNVNGLYKQICADPLYILINLNNQSNVQLYVKENERSLCKIFSLE